MVYTRTLKAKFDIHPGRVRRPRTSNLRQRYLLSRREHPELVAINPPEMSSINTDNAVNFFSNSADASVNSEELEDISINNDNFSQNDDYNASTQKMADGPEPFQPFDGEYGLYFANFTEQMLFLWVTKNMICK